MKLGKIRNLSEGFPGGLKKLAANIGMSEQNLHRCINNNKIQAGDLEQIAACLKVSILTFFDESPQAGTVSSGNSLSGNVIISGRNKVGDIDARRYDSDSPDVLRAQIALLDMNIKEKDSQIKEKDSQIKQLLDILQAFKTK